MYMYFVVPQMPSPRSDLPSGLILLPEFISEAYEKELLSLIEWDKVAELEQSGNKMYLIAITLITLLENGEPSPTFVKQFLKSGQS